jgi:type IV pilus assembly protein PilQ
VGNIELIKNIVASIDKVTPQVIIEARIVEANSDFTREVGFDWGEVTLGPFSSGLFGGDITLDFSADNLPAASTGELGFNFVRAVGTPFSIVNARLQVNESEGNVKIISAPKVITLDNKQAKIKQGVEWPYQERDSAGNSTVKFKDIDLLLEVTPHVTPDERIALGIYITKNDVGTITNGVPSLITNEAETELLVNDGDTIVIGGIIKTTIADGGAGIPGMRDIPAIGWLFGTTTKSSLRQELLIFISPRIVQLEQR